MTKEKIEVYDFNYSQFEFAVDSIANQIERSSFNPDYIVGIVRGGAVPAVHLSHILGIPVVMIHWNTRDGGVAGNETNAWIPEDLVGGKRVLIVDDIVDGGETIKQLLDDWQSSVRQPIERTSYAIASLIFNVRSGIDVDFYAEEIDREVDKRWVRFHWE